MILIQTTCSICGKLRKFVRNTPRHKLHICGNCWDWEKYPPQPLDLVEGKI